MKKITIHQVTFCGILAAVYAALTICTSAISYGQIQFRLAEALCILPYFNPVSTIGLTLGCLIANLFSTVSALDIIVGTAATLLACLLVQRCRKPALVPKSFLLFSAQVGGGELAVMYLIGLPLLLLLRKNELGDRIAKL